MTQARVLALATMAILVACLLVTACSPATNPLHVEDPNAYRLAKVRMVNHSDVDLIHVQVYTEIKDLEGTAGQWLSSSVKRGHGTASRRIEVAGKIHNGDGTWIPAHRLYLGYSTKRKPAGYSVTIDNPGLEEGRYYKITVYGAESRGGGGLQGTLEEITPLAKSMEAGIARDSD